MIFDISILNIIICLVIGLAVFLAPLYDFANNGDFDTEFSNLFLDEIGALLGGIIYRLFINRSWNNVEPLGIIFSFAFSIIVLILVKIISSEAKAEKLKPVEEKKLKEIIINKTNTDEEEHNKVLDERISEDLNKSK